MERTESEDYRQRESQWDDAWPAPPEEHAAEEPDIQDEDSPYPETVGTSDAAFAVSEGEPYTPAVDPPVLPGGRDGIEVATGFGFSSDEEASEEPAPRGDEDIADEVSLTLRQDSIASSYGFSVSVRDGFVTLRGTVGSLDEVEHILSVVSELPGVVDVVDETTLQPAGA
jgi:BON domain